MAGMDRLKSALAYAARGWRVVPLADRDKMPRLDGWPSKATTDEATIVEWLIRWPDANIGVQLGPASGLVDVECDTPEAEAALFSLCGPLAGVPAFRGSRGLHRLFAWQEGLPDKAVAKVNGIEVRIGGGGKGAQSVFPPSIHPTGAVYAWECEPSIGLPALPEPLVARLAPLPAPPIDLGPSVRTDTIERARRYLAVVPPAVSGSGGHNQTFRAACVLILGFGLSVDHAYPLLAEWNATCQPPWSEKELRHKLADAEKQPGRRGFLLDGQSYDGPDVDLRALIASLAAPVEQPAQMPAEPTFPTECFAGMPRLMRLAFDWVERTAIKPQPQLTLSALIALFGAVFGRLVRDDYGTRTNVMMLSLALSGSGKEHARQCNKLILTHAGLDLINGPERIGSHAGIISAIAQHPVRLFQLDEIGRLLATMRNPEATHLFNVASVLMQLYSSAGTLWTGDAYADLNKVKRINQPCVCVYGTAVPEGFYSGLTPENLSDGLLARMLIFEADGYGQRKRPVIADPPAELIEGIKAWHSSQPVGNLAAVNPTPREIEKEPAAATRHEKHSDEINAQHPKDSPHEASLWSRAPEKAAKLALIFACCDAERPDKAIITLRAVDWARKLVNHATRLVVSRATSGVVRSGYDRQKKEAWKAIRNGMTLSEFTRKTQWLRRRDRGEILDDWVQAGLVVLEEEKTTGRPKTIVKVMRK